jgi:hypothetical protein
MIESQRRMWAARAEATVRLLWSTRHRTEARVRLRYWVNLLKSLRKESCHDNERNGQLGCDCPRPDSSRVPRATRTP